MKLLLVFGLMAVAFGSIAVWDKHRLPFDENLRFVYRYETQVATGMPAASDLHSLTYLSMNLNFMFSDRYEIVMQISDVVAGTLNEELQKVNKILPAKHFKTVTLDEEKLDQLRLPVKFSGTHGLITNLYFDKTDSVWSKNVKRAAIALFSIDSFKAFPSQFESLLENRQPEKNETTLEGECEVLYSIPRVMNTGKGGEKLSTLTKSIDFTHCKQRADINYENSNAELCKDYSTNSEPELKSIKRSTTFSYVYSQSMFKKVDSLSVYVAPSLVRSENADVVTTVVSKAQYLEHKRTPEGRLEGPRQGVDESLLYNNEIEKLIEKFEHEGDEALKGKNSPFPVIPNKIDQIQTMMKKIATTVGTRAHGLTYKHNIDYVKLVELFRTLKIDEIQQIYDELKVIDAPFVDELFFNLLATSGTYNTVKMIVDKALKEKIDMKFLAQIIKIINIRNPSEKQLNEILRLCKFDLLKKNSFAHQGAWLTFGSLVNKWVKMNKFNNLTEEEQSKGYLRNFMELYREAKTVSEKIIALKALGNAGLEESIMDLEKLIYDKELEKIVRMQAIDSLRQLRSNVPHQIHKLLLPLFQDRTEQSDHRMNAFAMLMQSFPEKKILTHIVKTIGEEPKSHVASFVLSMMEALSKSTNPCEQTIAQDLQDLVNLSQLKLTPQKLSESYNHISMYSDQKRTGVFVNIAQLNDGDLIPKELMAGVDALFSGDLYKSIVQFDMIQQNMEKTAQKFFDFMKKQFDTETVDWEENSSMNRGKRVITKSPIEMLKHLANTLRIQSRDNLEKPLLMVQLRVKNLDYMVFNVDLKFIEQLIQMIESIYESGRMKSLMEMVAKMVENVAYHLSSNNYETLSKLPTMSGFPLHTKNIVNTIVLVNGKVDSRSLSENKLSAKIKPTFSTSHMFMSALWSPWATTGVETVKSLELNFPFEMIGEYTDDREFNGLKLTYKTPEAAQRFAGLHTIPNTFVALVDKDDIDMKIIYNRELVHTEHTVEEKYLEMSGLPVVAKGHGYELWTLNKPLEVLLTGWNHYELTMEPNQDTPKEMSAFFKWSMKGHQRRSEASTMSDWSDSDGEEIVVGSEDEYGMAHQHRESRHSMEDKKYSASMVLVADSRRTDRNLKIDVDVQKNKGGLKGEIVFVRTRIAQWNESSKWSFNTKFDMKMPAELRSLRDITELTPEKFTITTSTQFGHEKERKQQIRTEFIGEHSEMLRQWIRSRASQLERRLGPMERRELLENNVVFDQFSLHARYNLRGPVKSSLYQWLSWWRMDNYLRSEVVAQSNGIMSKSELRVKVNLDKHFRHFANITFEMPTEQMIFHEIELPFTIPMWIENFKLNKMVMPEKSNECVLARGKLKTFTDLVYSLPLKVSSCNNVLVKDCSTGDDEHMRPKFAVLAKHISSDDRKRLTILTEKAKIEAEMETSYTDKMLVYVNGKLIEDEELLEPFGITLREKIFEFENSHIRVSFDGHRISTQVSKLFKNRKCGLCVKSQDDSDDEWRMADNRKTMKINEFHESFIEKTEACAIDHEEMNRSKYMTDDSEEREEFSDRPSRIERTKVIRSWDHMCFSTRPVMICPKGSSPSETERVYHRFNCLESSTPEARRLLRESENMFIDITHMELDIVKSFGKNIEVPIICEA